MTHQKKTWQAPSASQEGWLPLEDEQLKEVTGAAPKDGLPPLRTLFVNDRDRSLDGKTLPPTHPAIEPNLRQLDINPEKVPANHSFRLTPEGLIRYIRTPFPVPSDVR